MSSYYRNSLFENHLDREYDESSAEIFVRQTNRLIQLYDRIVTEYKILITDKKKLFTWKDRYQRYIQLLDRYNYLAKYYCSEANIPVPFIPKEDKFTGLNSDIATQIYELVIKDQKYISQANMISLRQYIENPSKVDLYNWKEISAIFMDYHWYRYYEKQQINDYVYLLELLIPYVPDNIISLINEEIDKIRESIIQVLDDFKKLNYQ